MGGFLPSTCSLRTFVSPEKTPHNFKVDCDVAYLESQDSNLCAGSNLKDYAFSGLGVDKFWYLYLKSEYSKQAISQLLFWNTKTEGSVYLLGFFFLFGSDFRGHRRRCKYFKLSNFSFSKNTVLVLRPLHFLVYDLLSQFI